MGDLFTQVKDNLLFIAVCALCVAATVVVAWLCQRFLIGSQREIAPARKCAFVGMFSAISAVLMLFEVPVFFAPGFYKLDFSELPVLLCSFALGPVAGVTAEALKVILKVLIKGTSTAFVGDFANFMVGVMLVLPASVIYGAAGRSRRSVIGGLAAGALLMTVFGSLFNAVYLLPKFADLYGLPLDDIIAMGSAVNASITDVSTLVLFAVAPLNLLKSAAVSVVTVLFHPSLERLLNVRK